MVVPELGHAAGGREGSGGGIEQFGVIERVAVPDIFGVTASGNQDCSVVEQGCSASPSTSYCQLACGGCEGSDGGIE